MPSPIIFSQDDQDTAQKMKNGIYDQSLIHSLYQFDVHTLHTRAIVHNDKMFVQKDNLKECQVLRHDNLVQLGTINTEEMVIFCSCVVGTSLFLGLSDKANKNFIRAYDIKTYKMLMSNPLQF